MLPWSQNFWITTVGSLSNDDGDDNENGRMLLTPRAVARLKERYEIARECSHFNRGRASLSPRSEARLKKDTRLLSKACVAAGLVARVTDSELDRAHIRDYSALVSSISWRFSSPITD